MDFQKNELFDIYIDNFKKLTLKDKKKITVDEIKEIMAVLVELNKRQGKESIIFVNREISDLNEGDEIEDDYVEAMFIYIKCIQELLGQYVEKG